MKKKPVILIIDNSIDVTGALKSIALSARELCDHFDYRFILPKDSRALPWLERQAFVVYQLPMREIRKDFNAIVRYLPALVENSLRLKRIIKDEAVDLIHNNDLYNMLPVFLKIGGMRVPYICHIRFLPERFPKLLLRSWLRLHVRFASSIVAVSKVVLKQLPLHPKIMMIYDRLPMEEHCAAPNADTSKTFLYLSNFMEGKGQDHAIRAFALVHQQLPDWKIRFVGSDMGLPKNKAYASGLRDLAKRLGVSEKIEWCGFTEDVEMEYKHADIVLNFSESESFSMTCAETLFYGRPLIATDCGGPSEIVSHGESGIIVGNREITQMSEAMTKLASNDALRRKLSMNGRAMVRDKFNYQETSHKLLQVYSQALSA
jgi:L-malate glycosyltransferase